MPRTKGTHKADKYFIIADAQVTPDLITTSSRAKNFGIYAIWVDNDLLGSDATLFQITTLNL